MVDALNPPSEVINELARLKASCKVIRVNKVDIQEEQNPIVQTFRERLRKYRRAEQGKL